MVGTLQHDIPSLSLSYDGQYNASFHSVSFQHAH